MSELVIVTPNCYLICEAIHHITVSDSDKEEKQFITRRKPNRRGIRKTSSKRNKAAQSKIYQITIEYVPLSNSQKNISMSNSNRETQTVTINVCGQERCYGLFRDMVSQIREQMPDQMYLDKIVEKILLANPDDKEK